MLLYGELNLFPPADTDALLQRCRDALAPSGRLLLEVHSHELTKRTGERPPRWSVVQSGLFSDRPHLRCDQSFWLEATQYAAGRHWIIDAATNEVTLYGWTQKAYTEAGYEALLTRNGLRIEGMHPSLTGAPDEAGFPVYIASRDSWSRSPGDHARFARTFVSLTTSTTAGRPDASALSSAGRIRSGFSTRMPKQPMSSASLREAHVVHERRGLADAAGVVVVHDDHRVEPAARRRLQLADVVVEARVADEADHRPVRQRGLGAEGAGEAPAEGAGAAEVALARLACCTICAVQIAAWKVSHDQGRVAGQPLRRAPCRCAPAGSAPRRSCGSGSLLGPVVRARSPARARQPLRRAAAATPTASISLLHASSCASPWIETAFG